MRVIDSRIFGVNQAMLYAVLDPVTKVSHIIPLYSILYCI